MKKNFKHIFSFFTLHFSLFVFHYSLYTLSANSLRLVRRGVRGEVILAFILHFSLFVFHFSLIAQTPKIDSLKKALYSLPKPTNKLSDSTYIITIQKLAWEYSFINPDTAIILAQQGLQLSEKINWKKGKAICLNALGQSNYLQGNYHQALEYYNTGLRIAEELSDKSLQAIFLGNIGIVYRNQSDYTKALEYYFKVLKISEELGDIRNMAVVLCNIGILCDDQSDYPKALEYYFKALKIFEELGDKRNIAVSLGNIGLVYAHQSDYPKALEYYFKALKIDEELGNKRGMAYRLDNIGNVYYDLSDYPKALEYYFKALKINEELGNKSNMAINLGNIGIVYAKQSNYPKALEYYFKALKMAEELGDKRSMANNLGNIGVVYADQSDYNKALEYYFKALKIDEELGDKRNMAFWLGNIGELYIEIGQFKEAEKYLKQALDLSYSLGTLDITRSTESFLYQLYYTLGQYKLALIHFKKYIAARDTIDNDEKRKKINYLVNKYEWEKKEALINAEREKERALFEANQRRNKIIIIAVTTGMIMLGVFLVFVYRSLRITRKQKAIIELQKQEVEKQKAEVEKQKEIAEQQKAQVEAQKKIIEDKNKDIMDSINYALRIQQAILPDNKKWERLLPDSFKLYLPKDVLAGDFYWLEENENYIYVAAADCTGHGVPGAMVSVVCSSALTKAVLEDKLTNTNEILDRVRKIVVEKMSSNEGHLRDGMDVCLVRINKSNRKEIQYSGANRPLYIIKSNGELEELSPDKQPIGWMEETHPFKSENKVLDQGDMLYLTTDGFADQFGGPKQKKLKTKGMLELFINIHSLPLNEQKVKIHTYYSDWKGSGDQTDDVCVIGIKV
jgi:tetratricopeptide (TPR) repeat protein